MTDDNAKIYVFYCANSLSAGETCALENKLHRQVKTVCLPCSGKADIQYLVKAFETGADGLAIVTCEIGTCRHLEGNMRAAKRCEAVSGLLEEIGAGSGRTCIIEHRQSEPDVTLNKLKQFCGGIKHLSRTYTSTTA